MHKLPTHLVPQADQAKARADDILRQMVVAVRDDLNDDFDSIGLWVCLNNGFVTHASSEKLASVLSSALIRLAQQ